MKKIKDYSVGISIVVGLLVTDWGLEQYNLTTLSKFIIYMVIYFGIHLLIQFLFKDK